VVNTLSIRVEYTAD